MTTKRHSDAIAWIAALLALFAMPRLAFAQLDAGVVVDATAAPIDGNPAMPSSATTIDPSANPNAATGTASDTVIDVGSAATAPRWTQWQVDGTLLEDAATLRTFLDPELESHRSLTAAATAEIGAACQKIGYHLVSITTATLSDGGVMATLNLDPIRIIQSVDVSISQSFCDILLDTEVQRRLRLGRGANLPWDPKERSKALIEEQRHIEDFLFDSGFFDAHAAINVIDEGLAAARMQINIQLGSHYVIGHVNINKVGTLSLSDVEIRAKFRVRGLLSWVPCIGQDRFTRTSYQASIRAAVELLQKRGYPGVRVSSDFDPALSVDRLSKTVNFTLRIDPRRQLDVVFEGNDPDQFAGDDLRKQLTFSQAASSDDFEANASATAIAAYYQSRGRFDTQVSWTRERFPDFDRITFQIDETKTREVRSVVFHGNRALGVDALHGVVATKVARALTLIDDNPQASGVDLANDTDRIRRLYKTYGYLDAVVDVHAGPDPAVVESAALTGVLVASERHLRDLHVRYDIDEGPQTVVSDITIKLFMPEGNAASTGGIASTGSSFAGINEERCRTAANKLAKSAKLIFRDIKPTATGCIATPIGAPLDENVLRNGGEAMRAWLWSIGRPRATVDVAIDRSGQRLHNAHVEYTLNAGRALRIGKVIVRGNFRTRPSVILSELGFFNGRPMTSDLLARGPRAVRAMGLFDSVTVDTVGSESSDSDISNVVLRVKERTPGLGTVDFEAGYSSVNGEFGTLTLTLPNLAGLGISTVASGTIGTLFNGVDLTVRIPRWLTGRVFPLAFDTEITLLDRTQITPRFGPLETKGGSLVATRTWQRPRSEDNTGRTLSASLRYDFRQRNRDEAALRPDGADDDLAQVPVQTVTGSVGIDLRWDQRTDRDGNINPLAPERGFQIDLQASFASPYLFGQDVFAKVSAVSQFFWPLSDKVLLRTDFRLDEGFPMGGAVLLPEVERFFAGGDSTVRGYEEDRLGTEIIQTGVGPIAGVSQVRVVPAGATIRALTSVDLQVKLLKKAPIASAIFMDAGMLRNTWTGMGLDDIRPALGIAIARILTPFGTGALEYAFPLFPHIGDDVRGRFHIGFALRF